MNGPCRGVTVVGGPCGSRSYLPALFERSQNGRFNVVRESTIFGASVLSRSLEEFAFESECYRLAHLVMLAKEGLYVRWKYARHPKGFQPA